MRRFVALWALVVVVPVSAWGLTVAPMSLGQMTEVAEIVVRARCTDRAATQNEDGGIE